MQGAREDAKMLLKWDASNELGRAIMSDQRVKTASRSFLWFS